MPGGPALAALFLPSRACWASRLFSFSSFAFSRLLFFLGCGFGLQAPPSSSPSSILTPLRATTGTQSAVHTLSNDGGQPRPPMHSLRSSYAPDQVRILAELTSQAPPWQLKAVQTGLHSTPGSQGSRMHQTRPVEPLRGRQGAARVLVSTTACVQLRDHISHVGQHARWSDAVRTSLRWRASSPQLVWTTQYRPDHSGRSQRATVSGRIT